MGRKKKDILDIPETPPAIDPVDRENQIISLAFNAAEQQLRDGTASPSVIVHFLRLGTERERLEKQILERQKDLLIAKTDSLQSMKRIEELYDNAISAMKTYSGQADESDSEIFGVNQF